MKYRSGRFFLWLIRGVASTVLLAFLGAFIMVAVFIAPEAYKHGREHGFYLDGRTTPQPTPASPFEAKKPVLTSTALADTLVYGGGAALGMLLALVILAGCDVATAILHTAMRAADIHELLKAKKA